MIAKIFVVIFVIFLPLQVMGASDGTLGATSTGVINISLTLNTVVQITNVKDVNLTYVSGTNSGDLEYVSDLCIYTNNPSGRYRITMISQNALGTKGRVINTDTGLSPLSYEATWFTNAQATGSSVHTLQSGVPTATLTGAHTTSNNCDNGANNTASIKFKFLESDLLATPGGNYNDVITIVVSPI